MKACTILQAPLTSRGPSGCKVLASPKARESSQQELIAITPDWLFKCLALRRQCLGQRLGARHRQLVTGCLSRKCD